MYRPSHTEIAREIIRMTNAGETENVVEYHKNHGGFFAAAARYYVRHGMVDMLKFTFEQDKSKVCRIAKELAFDFPYSPNLECIEYAHMHPSIETELIFNRTTLICLAKEAHNDECVEYLSTQIPTIREKCDSIQ